MDKMTWNQQLKQWAIQEFVKKDFQEGSKVKIRKDSEYFHQNKGIGTIKGPGWGGYRVTFEDGYSNVYFDNDLKLINFSGKLTTEALFSAAEKLRISPKEFNSYIRGAPEKLSKIPTDQKRRFYQITGIDVFKPRLPVFEDRGLLDINGKKYKVNFLDGDFGKAILEEYKNELKKYPNAEAELNVLSTSFGGIGGSNIFSTILLNQIIKNRGFRIATPSDLEKILGQDLLNLEGVRIETGLVLRSRCRANGNLASHLAEQIKKRDGKVQYPCVIPLTSLELDAPVDSAYDLGFKLTNNGKVIYAPQLLPTLYDQDEIKTFNDTDKDGLPKLVKDGRRELYLGNFGLRKLTVINGTFYNTISEDFDQSSASKRIIIIKTRKSS